MRSTDRLKIRVCAPLTLLLTDRYDPVPVSMKFHAKYSKIGLKNIMLIMTRPELEKMVRLLGFDPKAENGLCIRMSKPRKPDSDGERIEKPVKRSDADVKKKILGTDALKAIDDCHNLSQSEAKVKELLSKMVSDEAIKGVLVRYLGHFYKSHPAIDEGDGKTIVTAIIKMWQAPDESVVAAPCPPSLSLGSRMIFLSSHHQGKTGANNQPVEGCQMRGLLSTLLQQLDEDVILSLIHI